MFELKPDAFKRFSDTQLEELVGRLCEAEVAARGGRVSDVVRGGSISAPDGGIDVLVKVEGNLQGMGFLNRNNVVIQVKKPSMAARAIDAEMKPEGELRACIEEMARCGGSYVIVSGGDDCGAKALDNRIKAMKAAAGYAAPLVVDFLGRSRLAQWLRQHPSVAVWARRELGRPMSGWRSYSRWSMPPAADTDDLISEPGVNVHICTQRREALSVSEALSPVRALVRDTEKALRVVGLSGVGKTRFVQALFEPTHGEALDRSNVIYGDVGHGLTPAPQELVEHLRSEGRAATIVLDNCPSELHSALSHMISGIGVPVRLITVEYDIRDDEPRLTDVVRIEVVGPDLAARLIARRLPNLDSASISRVAKFAGGNARMALALAERIETGESVAMLKEEELFRRLFEQNHGADASLLASATALALLYSFSTSSRESGVDELSVLGGIFGASRTQLLRASAELVRRGLVQRRGSWRAVLPHAVANRLVGRALDEVDEETLLNVLEQPEHIRILQSFAHRIGYVHDHPVVTSVASRWLEHDGILGDPASIHQKLVQVFDRVAVIAPEQTLDWLETADLTRVPLGGLQASDLIRALSTIAYEGTHFATCIDRLAGLCLETTGGFDTDYNFARNTLMRLFQPRLSGTHASLAARCAAACSLIGSSDTIRSNLGIAALRSALGTGPWTGRAWSRMNSRQLDEGFCPSPEQLMQWYVAFIDLAVAVGSAGSEPARSGAREVLAESFRGLWNTRLVADRLEAAAEKLEQSGGWFEGWKAVRATLYFGLRAEPPRSPHAALLRLSSLLEPRGELSIVRAVVLGGASCWEIDNELNAQPENDLVESVRRTEERTETLGVQHADQVAFVGALADELLAATQDLERVSAFGRGLAQSGSPEEIWQTFIVALNVRAADNYVSSAVLTGFLEGLSKTDRNLTSELLDRAAVDPRLRNVIVYLHLRVPFGDDDFVRCMKVATRDAAPHQFGRLLWDTNFLTVQPEQQAELAAILLEKPLGPAVVVEALSLRLHGVLPGSDALGPDLRRVALAAARLQAPICLDDYSGGSDYRLANVVREVLTGSTDTDVSNTWLDALFQFVDVDSNMRGLRQTMGATASAASEEFLSRVFECDEELSLTRQASVEHVSALANVDVERLIGWCESHEEPSWQQVARGIGAFDESPGRKVRLSEQAVRFLEAAPDPTAVLRAYSEASGPDFGFGRRVDQWQRRAEALNVLTGHVNARIAEATQSVQGRISGWIAHSKAQESVDSDQRFE